MPPIMVTPPAVNSSVPPVLSEKANENSENEAELKEQAQRGAGQAKWPKLTAFFHWVKLKAFSTVGTMLITICAYSFLLGWKLATGFILLLLAHEYGHIFQLKREGIDASSPKFIPFLGAVVVMNDAPRNAMIEARVGLAGPVLGTLTCFIPTAIYLLTGSELFSAIAFLGFFLNLFNLLPITPLDGGRAAAAVSPWLWVIGFVGLTGFAVLTQSVIVAIIATFCAFSMFDRLKDRKNEGAYYKQVSTKERLLVLGVYILLVVILLVGMNITVPTNTIG